MSKLDKVIDEAQAQKERNQRFERAVLFLIKALVALAAIGICLKIYMLAL